MKLDKVSPFFLLSNIECKCGCAINLNKANAHIINDDEAMKSWGRDYEIGWEIKIL